MMPQPTLGTGPVEPDRIGRVREEITLSPPTPPRQILIHYHIFKNAGTSIERSLETVFGDDLFPFETDRPDGHLDPENAERLIADHPQLRAITSHQLHPPLPSGDFAVFPLVVLREPISRVRSAYLFEWQKQIGRQQPKGSLADYVEEKLATGQPGVVADFQVAHLSRRLLADQGRSWSDMEAGLELATTFLDGLSVFGLVERLDESVALFNAALIEFYGHGRVQLEPRRDNVSQDPSLSVDEIHQQMADELGPSLFELLVERNRFDTELYRWASDRFSAAMSSMAQPDDDDQVMASSTPNTGPVSQPVVMTSPLQVAKLERRVQWQDEVLSDIENTRRQEQNRLKQIESRYYETRRRLLTLEAAARLPVAQPKVMSRRARLLARFRPGVDSGQEHHQTQSGPDDYLLHMQRVVAESGLFDPDYYSEHNPDVVEAGVNPLEHYVLHGGLEGRAPSELFDSAWYLAQNPDVRQAGVNPLVHYVLHGGDEGRRAQAPDGSATEFDPNPHDIPEPDEYEDICRSLLFDQPDDPDVSIIIPVFNEVGYTLSCLESVAALQTRYSFEVLVMDDASDDPDVKILESVSGLRYIRNDENLGFLRNCNRGAEHANGRFIVFLNNDTRVDSQWLEALVDTFHEHENVGLVGSKLVYGDGRLQEAGGIIFRDGSGWNYGRSEDPDRPRFNYVRDVDYASGASIMIERAYFDRLGRFDEAFVPAYYEDTDLCFRVRADGKRVLFQPHSVVTHFEGISSGTDLTTGVKMHQEVNKVAFELKWRDVLQQAHQPDSSRLALAADPAPRGHVLIVDAATPTPDQDSGSIDMFNLIRIIREMGYRVHFIPSNGMLHSGSYTRDLQQLGVKCVYEPYYTTPGAYVAECGDVFDAVILSRVNVATACLNDVLVHCPSARLIFYTVDLHFLRALRSAEVRNDRRDLRRAEELRHTELAIMDRVDTTVVLSHREKDILAELGKTDVAVIPLIRQPVPALRYGFEDRDGVMFVGGFRHPPNVDAVEWLLSEIWPLVRQECIERGLEPLRLRIIGSNIPRRLREYGEDVEIYGFVENLDPIFERALLSVAPLRYGAGLKGKIATSFDFGVPVVGTSVAFEGMPAEGLDDVALVADSAADMARLLVDIAGDGRRWDQVSTAGRDYITRHYSLDAIRPKVVELIEGDRDAGPKTT